MARLVGDQLEEDEPELARIEHPPRPRPRPRPPRPPPPQSPQSPGPKPCPSRAGPCPSRRSRPECRSRGGRSSAHPEPHDSPKLSLVCLRYILSRSSSTACVASAREFRLEERIWPTFSPTIRRRAAPAAPAEGAPLADRLRPQRLEEVVGQEHLTGPDGAIGRMVAAGKLASMILWGPPGTGKTTIARLLADAVGMRFVAISAVFSGVADLKKVFAEAREHRADRPADPAVRGRDPPLQPRPAGRLPALCRGRHRGPGRRDHRESELRAERRPASAARRC